jgi:hypothetical protein
MLRYWFLICGSLLTLGVGRADWQDVQSLGPGAPILVKSGFVTDAGTFVRSTSDSVSIHTRSGQVTIAKDDIDEVTVFRSRSDRTRKALLWGGVSAAATAAVMFPIFANFSNPNFIAPSTLTATNGALVGFGNYRNAKTKRIYRRSK